MYRLWNDKRVRLLENTDLIKKLWVPLESALRMGLTGPYPVKTEAKGYIITIQPAFDKETADGIRHQRAQAKEETRMAEQSGS